MRRRSRLILGLILMTIFATLGGFYAKIRLSFCGLLAHACYAISFIGGFYIYIMIDYLVTNGDRET